MDKQTQDSQEMLSEGNPADNNQAQAADEGSERIHPENADAQTDGADSRDGQKSRNKWVKSVPLLIVEICVLALAIGIMYIVVTATEEVDRKEIDEEKIAINEEIVEILQDEESDVVMGYRNIALFGVDARDGELGRGTRSDTIIIASINQDTKEIKLISVFRDTYLNLGNDTYN